ncbi:DUF4250 domain-containing protein [Aeromonas jandaei]|nr:DUF4250 domain-containing protein [Aeromonas jandaei]MVG14576.1 DUF4250 domain-containing protein [Aeromonas jandaei]
MVYHPWLYRSSRGGSEMDISTLQRLDANILLGIINEKLRLECDGLEELLAYYDMSEEQLAVRLGQIGYHYDPLSNQFKAHT